VQEVAAHWGEGLGLQVRQYIIIIILVLDERTASIIPIPGVKTRPLTMLKALVSGRLFCRASNRWSPAQDPIICALETLCIKHIVKKKSKERSENKDVIAQQRWASCVAQQQQRRATELKRAKGQPAHHTTKQSYGEGRGHYSIARPAISRIKPWASDGTVQSCFPKGQAAVMRLMNCLWHIETAGKILPCGRTVFETFCV
jgi:hypothetical protein